LAFAVCDFIDAQCVNTRHRRWHPASVLQNGVHLIDFAQLELAPAFVLKSFELQETVPSRGIILNILRVGLLTPICRDADNAQLLIT
jgi:hypothetical protein